MRRSAAFQAQPDPQYGRRAYARGKPLSVAVSGEVDPLDAAIVSAVLYASLFEFPLTASEVHRALSVPASLDDVTRRLRHSDWLRCRVALADGFVVPTGRVDLIGVRRHREIVSRAFLGAHASTLRALGSLPFTRLLAISGSLAHLNANDDADLDLFVVAADGHVWTVGVLMIAIARLLGRRREVCVNYILSRSAMQLEQPDWFTANQVVSLRPVDGHGVYEALLGQNPFVHRWFPNAGAAADYPRLAGGRPIVRRLLEWCLRPIGSRLERLCRHVYERHLRSRESSWPSPGQVTLSADVLKLHTRSHRASIVLRHAALLQAAGLSAPATDHPRGDVWPGNNSRRAG